MTKWDFPQKSKFGSKVNQCNTPINIMNVKTHMIISTYALKAFDKTFNTLRQKGISSDC